MALGVNSVVDMATDAGRIQREATPLEKRKHWAWLEQGYTLPILVPSFPAQQSKTEAKSTKAPSIIITAPMIGMP